MFRNAGYDPVVQPASIHEDIPFGMSPEDATMFLAQQKAMAVYSVMQPKLPDEWSIVAADTVVVVDGKIIGKPVDKDDAFATLHSMKNRSHHVITGCCILKPLLDDVSSTSADNNNRPVSQDDDDTQVKKICFYEDTEVWFTDYSDEDLLAYVNTPEPYDKAGGYAIQGTFGKYIDHIDGDYDNVVGLPFARVQSVL